MVSADRLRCCTCRVPVVIIRADIDTRTVFMSTGRTNLTGVRTFVVKGIVVTPQLVVYYRPRVTA